MHPVGAVHPVKFRQMLINFKHNGTSIFENSSPCIIGDTQAAVAIVIGGRYRNKSHIDADMLTVKLRQ